MAHYAKLARIHNPKYKRSGIKSYVFLLNKYKFAPTKPGPYQRAQVRKPTGIRRVLALIGIKQKHAHHGHKSGGLTKTDPTTGQSTEVTAEDQQNDSEYLVPVSIGTPAKTFNLDFDTGSSDLWVSPKRLHSWNSAIEAGQDVLNMPAMKEPLILITSSGIGQSSEFCAISMHYVFSSELPKSTNTSGHNVYTPTSSSSAKKVTGATWKISYGDGSSASGDVYQDTVKIGSITITGQDVEAAKVLSSEFASGVGDGLLGLAWPAINTVQPTAAATPVENMISQNLLSAGLFTAHLASWRDTNAANNAGQSFYTFGDIDQDVLTASNVTEPYYTPVDNSQGFWSFSSATASVNGQSIARSGNTAIADTGTTLALVDDSTVEAIYKAIPGSKYDSQQQGYVFPTSTTPDQLPVVKFAVGDQEFAVPKSSLAFAETGDGNYYGGIQSRGTMTFDILGDTFLKGIYAIFDQANTQFGAVQRPDPTGSTIAPPPAQQGQ